MNIKEVVALGYREVLAKVDGYMEGRIFPTWQPFSRPKLIKFTIIDCGRDMYVLDNKTFILQDDEDDLDFYENNGKVYVDYPEVMAERDY